MLYAGIVCIGYDSKLAADVKEIVLDARGDRATRSRT